MQLAGLHSDLALCSLSLHSEKRVSVLTAQLLPGSRQHVVEDVEAPLVFSLSHSSRLLQKIWQFNQGQNIKRKSSSTASSIRKKTVHGKVINLICLAPLKPSDFIHHFIWTSVLFLQEGQMSRLLLMMHKSELNRCKVWQRAETPPEFLHLWGWSVNAAPGKEV